MLLSSKSILTESQINDISAKKSLNKTGFKHAIPKMIVFLLSLKTLCFDHG